MDIDIYQQCPCHSGKKIKFCCGRDIVSELNQVAAKCNSNQSLSALDQIERIIAKHGEKDCLLNLQTHILFTLGENEKAEESNRKFVARNPNNPMGRMHEALTALAKGDTRSAIDKLQDAVDLVQGNEIPLPMANAFKLVGGILLSAGHLIAARAHLHFAMSIRGGEAEDIQALLSQSHMIPGTPLILKFGYHFDPVPADKEWAEKYELVVKTINRGQLRLGLKMLQRMDEHWADQVEIVRGMALVRCMLADDENMSSEWRRVAQLKDIPEWQAVEAESLSQIFCEEPPSSELDIVSREMTINDMDAVFEIFESNQRFDAAEVPEVDPFEQGPAPRHAYYVLDRDKVEASPELTAMDVPLVVGEILLYGKQTDREARMILVATKNKFFDSTTELIKASFSSFIANDGSEEIISATTQVNDVLAWNWRMPKGVGVEQHRKLIGEYRRHILVDKWPNIKFTCLDNLTPLEAKDKSEFAIPLAGLILNLEQSSLLQMSGEEDLNELKQNLGISTRNDLDASEHSEEDWTPLRLRQFDPKTFSDQQLVQAYIDSVSISDAQLLKRVIPEVLNRESLEQIPRDICYTMMAQFTESDTEAVEYLNHARQEAKKAGKSIGPVLVREFETRLTRGLTEKLPDLLQTIQQRHLGDPNVEYMLMQILTKFGLISPDGRTVSLPSATAAEPESDSKIWTPDSDSSTVSSGAASEGSKIWVPGSD